MTRCGPYVLFLLLFKSYKARPADLGVTAHYLLVVQTQIYRRSTVFILIGMAPFENWRRRALENERDCG